MGVNVFNKRMRTSRSFKPCCSAQSSNGCNFRYFLYLEEARYAFQFMSLSFEVSLFLSKKQIIWCLLTIPKLVILSFYLLLIITLYFFKIWWLTPPNCIFNLDGYIFFNYFSESLCLKKNTTYYDNLFCWVVHSTSWLTFILEYLQWMDANLSIHPLTLLHTNF